MNKERELVNEYYDNPQDFLDDLAKINVRKLVNKSDKELIQKLRRWTKQYWKEDGSMFLFESQYKRLKAMIEQLDLAE